METHDNRCRHLSQAGECAVLSVDYRRAPESTFPAALEDAYTATNWVAADGDESCLDTVPIAIGGGSAGRNLAATTLMTDDHGGPGLAHRSLAYPAVSSPAVHAFDSREKNADGYFLETQAMELFVDCYVDDDIDRRNEYFAPLLARDRSETPPATVLTAGFDPLREGVTYAGRLADAGVLVEHYSEDLIHGFLGMVETIPPVAEVMEAVGDDLQAAFAA